MLHSKETTMFLGGEFVALDHEVEVPHEHLDGHIPLLI